MVAEELNNFIALIELDLNTQFKFDETKARKVYERLNEIWKEKIGSGSVIPALKAQTVALKKKLGYSNPTAPLFGTGEMMDSLELAEFSESVLLIANNAKVDPSWHMNEDASRRGTNVPRRDPFSDVDLVEIIIQVLEETEYNNA